MTNCERRDDRLSVCRVLLCINFADYCFPFRFDIIDRQFQNGDKIGDYRILGFLGQGGMGEVYQGVHENLKRPAAIKILSAGADDPNFTTRFFNEARLQAGLHHPNIATLYDFRELGGRLFIFMEFVDGESLEDLVKRKSHSIDETLRLFYSICGAVDYVHQNGIVHRDLKSQNIKITSTGKVKLLDFGIAKDASSLGVTQVGGVIGTPHYLAPEQLGGQSAGKHADIWALGVILYEMLTGKLPFESESLAGLVYKISNVQFEPPENMGRSIPAGVAEIVKKCLKKEAESRYQTIGELQKNLRLQMDSLTGEAINPDAATVISAGFSADRLVPAAPVAPYSPTAAAVEETYTPEPMNKSRLPMILMIGGAAFVVFLLVVSAGTGVWFWSGSDTPAVNSPAGPANVRKLSGQSDTKRPSQKVRVDVDEGKAKVLRDGQLLGTTPLDLEAATGENVVLTLQREGFQDKNVSVEVSTQKKVFTFSMKQK